MGDKWWWWQKGEKKEHSGDIFSAFVSSPTVINNFCIFLSNDQESNRQACGDEYAHNVCTGGTAHQWQTPLGVMKEHIGSIKVKYDRWPI